LRWGRGEVGAAGRCAILDKSRALDWGAAAGRGAGIDKSKSHDPGIQELEGCAGWSLRGAAFARIPSEDPVVLAGMGRSPHEKGTASKVARASRAGINPERKPGIFPMATFGNHPGHHATSRFLAKPPY